MTRDEVMALSEQELCAEIAKEFGWEFCQESWYDEEGVEGTRITSPEGKEFFAYGWGERCSLDDIKELPDWPNDIKAAFELEESIPENERNHYAACLDILIIKDIKTLFTEDGKIFHWFISHATAEQRSRAWLIWKKESEK